MTSYHTRLLILGSGPAGYTAAIYAARAMLEPLLVQGGQPGGQLTITTDVENYPGFSKAVQGPDLMEAMRQQAQEMGTKIIADTIIAVDLKQRPFQLIGDSADHYSCDGLIIATGAEARWLGLPSEEFYKGYGVSACATCDGFFYRDKHVLVVGGGNTAVEEALFLTKFAAKVTLIHRRDQLRAEAILQKRLFANSKIDIIWDHEIAEIEGMTDPKSVTAATIRNLKSGLSCKISCDGIFIAIGHQPATDLFKGQLPLNNSGYLLTENRSTATSVAGVYAAGDVTDDIYRQAVTAAGQGCMAAIEAQHWLSIVEEEASAGVENSKVLKDGLG